MLLLLMVSVLLLVFQYKPVQTWAAKKGAAYLSEKLGTTVGIKSLYVEPFSAVVLEGFYVLDQQQDTLVSTPKLTVNLNGFSVFSSIQEHKLDFKLIQLDNGSVYLKKLNNGHSNLQFILDHLKSTDTAKTVSKPWAMTFEQTAINNFHFRYKNQLVKDKISGVNFDDIDMYNFSVVVNHMDIMHHIFKGDVRHLTLKEKSGFSIKNFTGNTTVDTNRILVQHMLIRTPKSTIRDYLSMKFKSFDDFSDFENKVLMDGDIRSSHISSTDIAYFTSGLEKINFELGVDGRIQGLVNNLKAKNLTVTAGQATFIKGDFNLKGLPNWDKTHLDLKFDQLATNKKDLDFLLSHFTGTPNTTAPDMLAKFGNINFSGSLTGKQSDFVAKGTFKTALGRFDPDINLKFNKAGTPGYNGKITAYDFNLGTLLNSDSTVGRTSFIANIKGSGDALKNLDAKIDAKISYIGLKGYQYRNVTLNGNFANKKMDGKLTINDKNIHFDANGSLDLNQKLPVYDFAATVKDAHLHTLNLVKDTITVSAQLQTKFSGNDLKNFEGHILLAPVRVVDPRNNYVLDSVYFFASGKGSERVIALRSDAIDGSIKGSYDLATLPSYFKTIIKKYIPSLQTDIVTPKPQNFEFNLKIKNLDPLTAIFVPDLKIPEQGTFVGKFNSDAKTATINGYIKTINYKKIIFHDLILDESTADDNLNINVSLNRIDLADNLFIKNIDVTNFVSKDSLKFNVKLADKDATNQLDLYGLVKFGQDTTARLILLPSDIILEHQDWRLQDQARVRLLDGKTQVSGFELSNGQQRVRIDGFISDKPEDKLKVTFNKFNMGTFDELTKAADISLKGILNGDVVLSSILKNPGADAHMNIDSLKMNKTLIGNVKIVSSLDNERSRANVNLNILNRGLETLNIGGSYYLGKEDGDKLDFDVKMNQTEAIIFEPFIKDLVSNIKGTVSTNLKLTGSLAKPQLNGDVTLANTGVTVNYLKTAYTVNDKLSVTNSVINVDNMVLKDIHGGQGTAKGTVDLNNLSNPTINVTLEAKNLMALNTAFKDNHVYFGTAYGTGTFNFNGPVDNMNIDIKARTEAGTVFNIPLNTSSTVSDYDFIKFVSHRDTAAINTAKEKAFNGVTLNFDLTVDEKTIVVITTDYGVLTGSGQAKPLNLHINSLGDFDMVGNFLITSGKFDFTAKNFISKNFTVNQGGTIRWTGDPSNAEINLNAIYEVRATTAPLYTAAGFGDKTTNTTELVQAELIITKSLIHPDINFDLNFPTDPSIKDDLATYFSDANNRNQQALSVIVTRSFSAGGSNNLTSQVVNTASNAVSEFAFNKLNSLIAQSNISHFDFNIRSFNDASASLKFWNDRLVINGSLFNNTGSNNLLNTNTGTGNQLSNTTLLNSSFNSLTKDFETSYLIRPDGTLTARYSYRVLNNTLSTININDLNVQYVNGLGLVYQTDFDTFGEFLKNIFTRKSKRRVNPLDAAPPPSPAPITPPPATTTTAPIVPAKKDEED